MDLDKLIRTDELTLQQWIKYILKLWEGLAFFHKHRFVHGDIKGPNIAFIRNKGFFFCDYDWSLIINTCEKVKTQLMLVRGISYLYWTPLIKFAALSCDSEQLLYFNDCYGLTHVTYDICKKLKLDTVKSYCKEILKIDNKDLISNYTAKKIYANLKILL